MSDHKNNPSIPQKPQPPRIFFEVQDPDEKVLLLLRRHFVTNLPWLSLAILMALVPLAFVFVRAELDSYALFNFFYNLPPKQRLLTLSIYYLGVFVHTFQSYLVWYFNVFLITNKRVMDVDLVGFLHRRVTEARLGQIQDIANTQGGLWAIIFNFGNIYVQTAGTTQDIEIREVPKPGFVHDFLTDLLAKT